MLGFIFSIDKTSQSITDVADISIKDDVKQLVNLFDQTWFTAALQFVLIAVNANSCHNALIA